MTDDVVSDRPIDVAGDFIRLCLATLLLAGVVVAAVVIAPIWAAVEAVRWAVRR